ncbi:EpsG family protein [Phocaeicola oris]|uniref:EpsG family protein n=1 Tax=Phocaeicola oris TaxID=2896850 RepID=UPI00234F8A1D|nr:EpsG family protein [Phocaeicola oris]MCE2617189.1 EpsG family protein [Phocaeicola oris]
MIIDFVPIQQYTHCFHIALLILVLFAVFQCQRGVIFRKDVVNMDAGWGFVIASLIIIYMGLRLVSAQFGDTMNYYKMFKDIANGIDIGDKSQEDIIFYTTLHWFAKYSNIHSFFLLCAFLYVAPLWLAMVRIFKSYYWIPFLVILSMFTFWQYGVNGVRNGVGASLFILAMTYVENLPVMALLSVLAIGFHKSVLLMVAGGALAWFIKNSYYYLAGWILCVIVSYFFGGQIQNYLAGIDFMAGDERFSGYMTGENMVGEIVQMSMVFRWDFLLYSSMAVVVGYYFIFRRDFKDEYYHWIYNTYLATNAFWILVIRAAYSNRFAQISWFIMPIVLIYPFMKQRFWTNHEKMLGYAILTFYAFAFYENILKSGIL